MTPRDVWLRLFQLVHKIFVIGKNETSLNRLSIVMFYCLLLIRVAVESSSGGSLCKQSVQAISGRTCHHDLSICSYVCKRAVGGTVISCRWDVTVWLGMNSGCSMSKTRVWYAHHYQSQTGGVYYTHELITLPFLLIVKWGRVHRDSRLTALTCCCLWLTTCRDQVTTAAKTSRHSRYIKRGETTFTAVLIVLTAVLRLTNCFWHPSCEIHR